MGFWTVKCPLHHTKSPCTTCETVLHSHLVWTQGDFVSPQPHKVASRDTQDNFGICTLHPCEVTLGVCIRAISPNVHHLHFGHCRDNISPPALHSHLMLMQGDFVSPPPHKGTLCDTQDNFGILTLHGSKVTYGVLDCEVSPPPHKVTLRDTRDSFAFSPCVDTR